MKGPRDTERTPGHPPAASTGLDAQAVEVLSHELRSPITTIHLGAKVLRGTGVRAPVRDAVLEAVDVEADRLLRVVEDLLVVVRHGAGTTALRLEPVLLQRRLAGLLSEGAGTAQGIRVRVYLPDDLPAVMADDAALGQVIRNLVVNADRHGASRHPTELVGELEPPDRVAIRVLDRGPGVDPDEVERLFQPFYRSLRSGGVTGAGLGLAAAQRLTHAMGGTITAGPRQGGGAVFTVRLRTAHPGE
jgi:two-component system sensor histidine kinase KdpD